MEEVFITAIVFTGIYQIIKSFTDYLLKRKIIVSGHIEKAGFLETPKEQGMNSYPTLKWGLVALFAGLGLIVIELINKNDDMYWAHDKHSYLPVGIELIAISLGFLVYFLIARFSKK